MDEGQHIIYLKESGISQALAHEVGHVIEACNVSYSSATRKGYLWSNYNVGSGLIPIHKGQKLGFIEDGVGIHYTGEVLDHLNVETSYCPDSGEAMLLSTSEMNLGEQEDGESNVRTFLYDRAESYVAYITHSSTE